MRWWRWLGYSESSLAAAAVVAAGGRALLPWEYRRRGGLAEDDEGCQGLGSSLLLLSPALGIAPASPRFAPILFPLSFFFSLIDPAVAILFFHLKQETFFIFL